MVRIDTSNIYKTECDPTSTELIFFDVIPNPKTIDNEVHEKCTKNIKLEKMFAKLRYPEW